MGQTVEETKGESVGSLCMWVGNTCTDRETGEAAGSRAQLGSENSQGTVR